MDIRIHSLTLDNFKGHRHLHIQFNGRNTTIYGNNGTGKTSVYDALTWLLFGKDSAGIKDFEVKPVDGTGSVLDHNAITSVEAALMVDSKVTIFKRTLQEVWATRRGSAQPVFTGNTSEYFVDGVPCKMYAYKDKVEELLPETLFRLLTSVRYFPAAMKWQDRRATLFDMVGTMTDQQIMSMDARFAPLAEGMGKLTLSEYKAKLAAEKKGFTGVKDQTPARLDECKKTVQDLANVDFDAARADLATLEAEHGSNAAQIIALDNNSAITAKRQEIRAKELELQELDSKNNAFRLSQTSGGLNLPALRRNLEDRSGDLAQLNAQIRAAENGLPAHDASIEESRSRWIAVNAEVYTGGTCPTCGRQLPTEQLQNAIDNFERMKQSRLRDIQATGEARKAAKAQAEANIQNMKDRAATLDAEVGRLKEQLRVGEASVVIPKDMDGYAEARQALTDAINALNGELSVMQTDSAAARQQLTLRNATLADKMREKREIIAKEAVLAHSRQRMAHIQEDARNAATGLEAIESVLFLVEEFTRFKAQFVEDSINSLFRLATIQLSREQNNGGVEDCCEVVYKGVPYTTNLNDGAKINVGIDIINALSRHYGVTVPLFVDNAESVTDLEPCGAQVIRLVVSESDKELRVTNEN